MKAKSSLLLLHGALGAKDQLNLLNDLLNDRYDVHLLNFSGHGGNESSKNFSIDLFAQDVVKYISSKDLKSINIFGYSMGGYVALKVALHNPDLVGKIFTLGTKFHWTPESATQEVKMLNPDKVKEKVPAFAKALEQRHQTANWEEVMQKTANMMLELGNGKSLKSEELKQIKHQVLITVGSDDNMVSVEESENTANHLPNSNFKIIPDWTHPIEKIDIPVLGQMINEFMMS